MEDDLQVELIGNTSLESVDVEKLQALIEVGMETKKNLTRPGGCSKCGKKGASKHKRVSTTPKRSNRRRLQVGN
jgi:hypothetical protein